MRERGGGDDYDSSDSVRHPHVLDVVSTDTLGLLRLERDDQR
jgi:hypothetical protein